MPVRARGGPPPDDATLIVHMGAGDHERLRRNAIASYDDYREIADDGFGLFALSVYAALGGHEVAEIVGALPWRQYGVCSAGDVRKYFSLLATTITDVADEPIDELQEVHFDVVLPHLDDDRLATPFALVSDPALIAEVEVGLDPHIATFRLLFEPRQVKPR